MSGCPHDIPAMRVSKGGDSDRPQVANDVSSGHLMYNTQHNYLEIYHSDSNNPTGWRDLIINNKEQIDISGTVRCDGSLVVLNDFSLIGHAHLSDISVNSIGPVDGSLIILGDISVNGQIFSSGGLVGGGGSGKDASFNVIQNFSDGSGITFISDVSINTRIKVPQLEVKTITEYANGSGILFENDVSINRHLYVVDASFGNNVTIGGVLNVNGDISNAIILDLSKNFHDLSGTYYTLSGDVTKNIISIGDISAHVSDLSINFIDLSKNFHDLSGTYYTLSGDVTKNIISIGDISAHVSDLSINFIDLSKNFHDLSGTYYTLSGDLDLFKQNVKTNDLSANNISVNSGNNIRFLSDVSFNKDVTITGDLIIDGSFNFNDIIHNITTVNNELLISTQLDICNQGTGPALEVTQIGNGGNNDIALFKSSGTDKAFEIKDDGKAIFYKDVSFIGKIIGDLSSEAFNDLSINFIDLSKNFHDLSGTYYTLSGDFDTFKQNVKTNDLSVNNISVNSGNNILFLSDVSFNQDASFTTIRADKILYSNMYDYVGDLPEATTYHGMFAHVHNTHGAYFSHAGQWVQLADLSRVEDLSFAVDAGAGGGGSSEDISINSAAITFLAGLLYDLSLSVDSGAGGGGGISPGQDASFGDIDADGYIAAGGSITAVGDITAFFSSSDERLKKNIYDISNYEDIIKNVRGVRFNWNDEAKNINSNVDLSKVELGVIAQEVEDYIPEIIKDGIGKYKAVRYEKITPILIECIKDLYTKVEKLEEEVRILKM